MSIRELVEEWREVYVAYRYAMDASYESGRESAGRACADELEAALPKWTRITDDPKTWPPLADDPSASEGDPAVMVRWRSELGIRQLYHWNKNSDWKFFSHWRPLCDLDFPPGELK